MRSEPASWSIVTAARFLAEGRLSAEEYITELIAHDRSGGELNAFITRTWDTALESAKAIDRSPRKGVLSGIPLTVKDNIDVACVPTTAGTPALRTHVARKDSGAWTRLRAAGAVLLGKTAMHELAYGITGASEAFPTPVNPAKVGRLPGGSSSGTAASVAGGLAPAGLGTDTGGSARIPASVCGVVGFRPTTGRYPDDGVVIISPSRDTVGLIARTVEDIMLLDAVLSGDVGETGTPPLKDAARLAVPDHAWRDLDPETARVAFGALEVLEQAGCVLVRTGPEIHGGPSDTLLKVSTAAPSAETPEAIEAYLRKSGLSLSFADVVRDIASKDVRAELEPLLDCPFPPDAYREAMEVQARLRTQAAAIRQDLRIDAVVTPTTILPAAPIGVGDTVPVAGRDVPTFLAYIRNTAPAVVLGLPSISLPVGLTAEGLPVGLQLDGAPGGDRRLLALAELCFQCLV